MDININAGDTSYFPGPFHGLSLVFVSVISLIFYLLKNTRAASRGQCQIVEVAIANILISMEN